MSTKAVYLGPDRFSITGSRAAEYPAGLRILADCTTDGLRLGSVTSAAYSAGRTAITLDVDGGAVLTANLASVTHAAVDLNSLPRHAAMHSADGPDPLDAAGLGFASADNLADEVAARQSHEGATNPHSGSASTSALAAVASELVAHEGDRNPHGTTAADVGASPSGHNHDGTYSPVAHLHAGTYAPAAQGVTNGDGHNHEGGDGGQIAHSSLSGAGTNSHTAIDNHLGDTSNPHGTTAAQVGAIPATTGAATAYVDAATTSAAGKVQLATSAEASTGTDTAKSVTPAALAAAAKGLISTNTTIYVSTTGSDTTGTGASGAPYATIAKALSSIASKLIASGVVVTIQCADGSYAVSSTITIDHPDGDKIQIIGNVSAETTVAISSIDTTAKTITVAGDYTASIQVGDIIGLLGSSTSGLNGSYLVSGVTYSGGNTVITCSAETIASATVGGGSIVIKPCNRVNLSFSAGVNGVVVKTALKNFSGIRMTAPSTSALCYGFSGINCRASVIGVKTIINGFKKSVFCDQAGVIHVAGTYCKNPYDVGIGNQLGSTIDISGYEDQTVIDGGNIGVMSNWGSFIYTYLPKLTLRGQAVSGYSPAINTVGNGNSYIQQ